MDSLKDLISYLPYVGEGLEKVQSKAWSQPLGLALAVTGDILSLAGEAGIPVIGLVGTALKIGGDLLTDDPAGDGHQEIISSNKEIKKIVQTSFKEVSKKMDVLKRE